MHRLVVPLHLSGILGDEAAFLGTAYLWITTVYSFEVRRYFFLPGESFFTCRVRTGKSLRRDRALCSNFTTFFMESPIFPIVGDVHAAVRCIYTLFGEGLHRIPGTPRVLLDDMWSLV
jgi:hypothetical protein